MESIDDLLKELNTSTNSGTFDIAGNSTPTSSLRLDNSDRPLSTEKQQQPGVEGAPPRRPSRRLANRAEDRPESAGYVPSQPRRPRSRNTTNGTDGYGILAVASNVQVMGATTVTQSLERCIAIHPAASSSSVDLSKGSSEIAQNQSPRAACHLDVSRPPLDVSHCGGPPLPLPQRHLPQASLDDDDAPRHFFGPKEGSGGHPPPQMGSCLGIEGAQEVMQVVGVPVLASSWNQGIFSAGFQPYGLHQVEGGPCGVIAVVQAFMLRALGEMGVNCAALLTVNESQRQEALADAIVEILWTNIGGGKKATLLNPGSGQISWQQLKGSTPFHFSSSGQLKAALQQRPWRDTFFQPSGSGLAALLLSVVLTRGPQAISKQDADDEKAAVMIGAHGYCTQELVNLMIFGRAYSNVFDGSKRIGNVKDGFCVLQGAPRRASVGFLSLFEAYKCIEVGQRLKSPLSPVWIVCAESHYTVLFSADMSVDPRDDTCAVELYYFDQLGRQSERIKLTVRPSSFPAIDGALDDSADAASDSVPQRRENEASESMIDKCIRTKWTNAGVDWNGTDVIL